MTDIDISRPILVTGATGYVAGWIVKALLEAGATVHAAVRDPGDADKLQHLDRLAARAPGRIRYFRADLMAPGSFAEAMAGCAVVLHAASPFTLAVTDPQKELVQPAVEGTRNVLQQANATDSVTRVVLTSSCAAIYTDAAECAAAPGGRLTEAVWNKTASLDYQPYSYSKTLAEQEAWQIADAQSRWRLVVVNPCLVMGPSIGGAPGSESFALIRRVVRGDMKHGAPRMGTGIVDVRDVAQAHVAAAFKPEARGRHIVCGHQTDLLTAVQTLAPRFGARHPIPKRALPKWLVWLIGPAVGLERRFVARNVDVPWRADNSKGIRELGLGYRPLRETMEDMFAQVTGGDEARAAA